MKLSTQFFYRRKRHLLTIVSVNLKENDHAKPEEQAKKYRQVLHLIFRFLFSTKLFQLSRYEDLIRCLLNIRGFKLLVYTKYEDFNPLIAVRRIILMYRVYKSTLDLRYGSPTGLSGGFFSTFLSKKVKKFVR